MFFSRKYIVKSISTPILRALWRKALNANDIFAFCKFCKLSIEMKLNTMLALCVHNDVIRGASAISCYK
jgi:hypothetical protein